jgi:hypothetical protein
VAWPSVLSSPLSFSATDIRVRSRNSRYRSNLDEKHRLRSTCTPGSPDTVFGYASEWLTGSLRSQTRSHAYYS